MAKDDKLLGAMRANPNGWRMADIERACRLAGLYCKPPTGGGSHYKISGSGHSQILTIPFKRPIKSVYVRALIRLIDESQLQ